MPRLPLLAALLALPVFLTPVVSAQDKPNVVLIISDDHAWTDYSFMGHPHIKTPNLDKLASESVTFRYGYVPSSLCCPSLASIITGLYPHQHKVTSNDPPLPRGMNNRQFQQSKEFTEGREVMNRHMDAVATLPRMLAKEGYLSFQTGKWWQGHFSRGGFTHGMTKGNRHGDEGLSIGRQGMKPIYDFIETARQQNKPFLVWYAPLLPHDPHTPPERLLAKYKSNAPTEHVAKYWAMVEWFDETCGELMKHLDDKGLAENTIVLYVADNGWIQNPDNPRFAPNSKQSPYDGGLRTPIMVRWPAKVKPRTSDRPVSSVDIAPTILAALGMAVPKEMQGLNLLDDAKVEARRAVFGACYTHNAVDLNDPAKNLRWRWAVRWPWKVIVPDATNEPGGKVELYDLAHDPHEARDLSVEQAEVVKELRGELDGWWKP